ncbi:hypothetical protein DW986_11365 [Parabacteroides merdae]|uniref:Uncharacterized protein n=1 Tax=Parabacteroides merdae TaxID=46503 RepID=A0A3R6E6I8_9BACT|nr:hypothetical protein [Parabacteroides merdae]RGZ46989.1 hypothetical protein DW986_11365 [Parabacteroides merdae]RHH74550.1 hypothetical protein DW191_17980 [Parabacteroides merdae]
MNKDNEKQLLTTGVYEAPKCEVVEMMGEGNLLIGSVEGGDGGEEWGRSSRRRDDDEDDF